MGQKYQKPIAKNLGEMLPNAEGYCITDGNSANLLPPALDCIPGSGAFGGICSVGSSATLPSVCVGTGTHPVNYGCVNGSLATPPGCNTGTQPL
jgi:hypothetical protein